MGNDPVNKIDPDGKIGKLIVAGLKYLAKKEVKDQAKDTAKDQAKKEAKDQTKGNGPKPNGGDAKPHGNENHNNAIDKKVEDLKKDPSVTNIRKNQQQVDKDGNKVGTNRPDVQYDKDGCHNCVEYDHNAQNSVKHGETIQANDPEAIVELNRL